MSGAQKPWEHAKAGGSQSDDLAERFVESLSYDTRLYKHDIAGSIAHARMLQKVRLINADELAAIERGLKEIQQEIEAAPGGVTAWEGWKVALEDVHMCIEAALIEKIGEPGKKLHTGRSRNDQVATDLLLWANDAGSEIGALISELVEAFVNLAQTSGHVVMPSYTHLQRAQPIVLGGELLAWASALDRCRARLSQFLTEGPLHDRFPLGAGAIAGSSLPLDRSFTQDHLLTGTPPTEGGWKIQRQLVRSTYSEMGWKPEVIDFVLSQADAGHSVMDSPGAYANSIDSTASRDVAIDLVYALSMTSMWLSRWAEQWIIYVTTEFGFLTIGEAYTTGSSMMPQKRNPDMLELIRGRCGGVYGRLVALLTICKGLPIGYNRDLQEDKHHVFAAYDTVRDCLKMAAAIVKSAKFNEERIKRDLDKGFLDATSLAEYLVTKGVPFRTAHQHVGALVRRCIDKGIVKLADLSIDQMKQISGCKAITEDVYDWLGAENVVKRYQTYGNAGLSGYREQLKAWKNRLNPADEAPPTAGLFGEGASLTDGDQSLIEAYQAQGRTLDDLPYTDEFEALFSAVGAGRTRQEVLHRLLNLRKAGKLPKIGRAKEAAPRVTKDQQAVLARFVKDTGRDLSERDQLPYTPEFDDLVIRFNAETGLQLSPYQVWRVVAKLAK